MAKILIENVSLNGAVVDVLIEGNRFKRIASELEVSGVDRVIDGSGQAILPPFFNGHNHAAMTLFRGFGDDMELFKWLNECIWPAEAKLTPDDVYAGTRLALLEMIKGGTVFFNDMYWHQGATVRAVREMGLRAAIGLMAICGSDGKVLPGNVAANAGLLELVPDDDPMISLTHAPHAIYTVTDGVFGEIAAAAQQDGRYIHIHVSETKREVEDCLKAHGMTPVAYLDKLGLIGARSVLAHCCWCTREDLELIAARRAVIAHMPVSNLKLCDGVLPFAVAEKAGCRVVLGTDGCSSNNNLSMFDEMKAAALSAKHQSGDPTSGKADTMFRIATVGGAEAFGLDSGVIAEGKLADAMLVDLDSPLMVGDYHMEANLVYSADTSVVRTVICDGRVLMENRAVPGEKEIIAEARRVCDKLRPFAAR